MRNTLHTRVHVVGPLALMLAVLTAGPVTEQRVVDARVSTLR